MGMQGNGDRGLVVHIDQVLAKLNQILSALQGWLSLILFVSGLWTGVVHAQTNYVYDANGRVVAVTQNNGATAQYSYDVLGHLVQTTTIASGQLAIFAFFPTHGEVGTPVTIEGQGFSPSIASDSVTFNGTPVTVLSASSTQITTMVPAGATTGPITVSVGSQSATSAASFVVDSGGLAPIISQATPSFVAAGGTVTVTGAHLDPAQGETAAQLGGGEVSLTSVSDAQLQFVVPGALSSGYVTVQTPYGNASSPNDVIVVPSGINASNIVSSGFATAGGNAVALNIGAADQIGAVVFRGSNGGFLSLQATGITTGANNLAYKIYGPGNVLVQSGTVSTTSPSIHIPQLTASGDYLAIFQPDTAGAQLSIALQADLQLTASSQLSATTESWQTDRMFFKTAQGSNLELTLNAVTGTTLGVSVTNAAGTQVAGMTCPPGNPGGSCRVSLWNAVAGTYTVLVTPSSAGTISFDAMQMADIVGPSPAPNTAAIVSLGAGQVERLTFNGVAGGVTALQLSNVSTVPAGQYFYVLVYQPGAVTTTNAYTMFDTGTSTTVYLTNLPATGTYTAIVYTLYGEPGSAQVTWLPQTISPLSENGGAQSFSTNGTGTAYLSFTANAGENLELTLNNISAGSLSASVTNGSGTVGSLSGCSGSCRVSLWNLASGSYTVTVTSGSGGAVSFNALLDSDVVGPTLTANTPVSVNLGAGQVERLTFAANAGQSVALQLSGATTVPPGSTVSMLIYEPGAITTTDAYTNYSVASSGTLNLTNLPASGTYTVMIYTSYGQPGSVQVTLSP